jgi:hypothetical protein
MESIQHTPAERTALNVFHDLELLYTRREHGAPEKAAAGRPGVASSDDSSPAADGTGPSVVGGWRQAFCQTQEGR